MTTQTITHTRYQVGDQLPSVETQAFVLEVKPIDTERSIILALLPGNVITPFVTWESYSSQREVESGDYCRTLSAAMQSLVDRR